MWEHYESISSQIHFRSSICTDMVHIVVNEEIIEKSFSGISMHSALAHGKHGTRSRALFNVPNTTILIPLKFYSRFRTSRNHNGKMLLQWNEIY